MKPKPIAWEVAENTTHNAVYDAELPLNFTAVIRRYNGEYHWSIINYRNLLRSGEEVSVVFAKQACEKAWQEELLSAFVGFPDPHDTIK